MKNFRLFSNPKLLENAGIYKPKDLSEQMLYLNWTGMKNPEQIQFESLDRSATATVIKLSRFWICLDSYESVRIWTDWKIVWTEKSVVEFLNLLNLK